MFDYKRIVVILPERLGDSLFHTPSIQLIKKARPEIHIDVIALSPLCASVLKNNPYIENVYISPTRNEMRQLASRYDIAISMHDHSVSRKYIEWLNIKTITVPGSPIPKNRSQNSLDFFQQLLDFPTSKEDSRYTLFPKEENFEKVSRLLKEQGISPDKDILIGCHIGCHSIAKRGLKIWRPLTHPKVWPLENFVALEAALRKHDKRIRLVLTGSKAERKLGEKFKQLAPMAINLIDRTSVLDLAALMETLTLFVSSDTGTLHVACASNVGIIALFGPTSLTVTGPHPMQDNYTVLQAPVISDITVAEVFGSVLTHPGLAKGN